MKKRLLSLFQIFLLIIAASYSVAAKGDADSGTLLDKMQAALRGFEAVGISYQFTARAEDGEVTGIQQGYFVGQGELFKITSEEMELYCDGRSKYIYDKSVQEVTIMPHDTANMDVAENPFGVLNKMNFSDYRYDKRTESLSFGGKECYRIILSPKDPNANYTSLSITLSSENALPVTILYNNKSGDSYFLEIKSMEEIRPLPESFYLLPDEIENNSDIFITDLR